MNKLLSSIGLPPGFDEEDSIAVEVDDEEMLIGETYVFETDLAFDAAVSRLDAHLTAVLGAEADRVDASDQPGWGGAAPAAIPRVANLTWRSEVQEVMAQIVEDDEGSAGFVTARTRWSWGRR